LKHERVRDIDTIRKLITWKGNDPVEDDFID
jgi:hypothetical protein